MSETTSTSTSRSAWMVDGAGKPGGLRSSTAGERLRADALEIFAGGVAAADPARVVARNLALGPHGRPIIVGEEVSPLGDIYLVAFGKAACAMVDGLRQVLPPDLVHSGSVVVTDAGNCRPLPGCRVYRGGHPVPNEGSVEAARLLAGDLLRTRAIDAVLVLVSGGGSALLTAPAPGLRLADKVATTHLLLESGATIREVNTVRKHLSFLKGGGLARLAHPAPVKALVLSDVVGDDPSVIASGPTVGDPTTFHDALEVLRHYELEDRVPVGVWDHLRRGERGEVPDTPKPGDPILERTETVVVGSNAMSLDAAAARARELGYQTSIVSRQLAGEARNVAHALARELGRPVERPTALLYGGETTVTVRGRGVGGRNQELALAFALAAEERQLDGGGWVLLSAGTDGRDGPTDAAGAVVDGSSLACGRQGGGDPAASLKDNDSHTFLDKSGDLLRTGPTGTNVADLQVLLRLPASH